MNLDKNGNPDVTRIVYLPISDEQKAYVEHIKLKANELHELYSKVSFTRTPEEGRLWALARTHLEIASMFAVKAATCSKNEP